MLKRARSTAGVGLQPAEQRLGAQPPKGAGTELRGPGQRERAGPGRDPDRLEVLRRELLGLGAEPREQAGLERGRIAGQLREVEHGEPITVDVLEDRRQVGVIAPVVDQLVDRPQRGGEIETGPPLAHHVEVGGHRALGRVPGTYHEPGGRERVQDPHDGLLVEEVVVAHFDGGRGVLVRVELA